MLDLIFKLYNKQVDYSGLRLFGCRCFSSLRHQVSNKFVRKTYPCIFIGYNNIHKGCRCLHPSTNHVYISRHVVFDEEFLPYAQHDMSQFQPRTLQLTEFPKFDEWKVKKNVEHFTSSHACERKTTNESLPSFDVHIDNDAGGNLGAQYDLQDLPIQATTTISQSPTLTQLLENLD